MLDYKKIISSLIELDGVDKNDLEKLITETKEIEKGDYSLPCFSFAKVLRKNPVEIANILCEQIKQKYHPFSSIEAVNGYLNFFVDRTKFCEDYFDFCDNNEVIYLKPYQNKTMVIDYCSANLAKYLHIGHLATTVIGESVARINEVLGYKVIRLNYVGDWGTPFGKMIAAYRLWGDKQDITKRGVDAVQDLYIRFAKEAENNPELEQLARDTFKALENGDKETVEIYKWIIDITIDETKRITDTLGITFDSWRGESYYNNKMDDVIKMLESKNLLQTSQGAKIVDLSDFGLNVCLIQKSDGTSLYITRDICAAIDRYKTYKFDKMVYVTAVQQKLHFEQLKKVLSLCGYDFSDNIIHCAYGMISLPEGKIASRKGKQALLKDILVEAVESAKEVVKDKGDELDIDEVSEVVGIGAVNYCPLKVEKVKDTVFDLEKALSFEGETSPYMQYTYARANNILERIELKNLCGVMPDYLSISDDISFELIKNLKNFNNVVISACEQSEPSIISRYLIDICKLFNRFYHQNKVAGTSPQVMSARVNLTMQFSKVLKEGLRLLNIKVTQKM